jgi:hypothetical protein
VDKSIAFNIERCETKMKQNEKKWNKNETKMKQNETKWNKNETKWNSSSSLRTRVQPTVFTSSVAFNIERCEKETMRTWNDEIMSSACSKKTCFTDPLRFRSAYFTLPDKHSWNWWCTSCSELFGTRCTPSDSHVSIS